MTYQRRQVPPTVIANAEKLLATFCETSGRRWKAWTSNGTPSPYMIQIVGALLAREDVTIAQWESAIKAVKREPHEWMGDRPMVLGDVFGARSADHSLDKAWKPASSNSKEAVLAAADAEERRMAQLQREKRLAREAADSRTGVNA